MNDSCTSDLLLYTTDYFLHPFDHEQHLSWELSVIG